MNMEFPIVCLFQTLLLLMILLKGQNHLILIPENRCGLREYVVFDNGMLHFNDVGIPEEGDYTCYAMNQFGKDEMKVRVKVKAAIFLPQISLRCNTKGKPTLVTTWISPTKRVIAPVLDKYQVLDIGTLVVQKVQRFDGGGKLSAIKVTGVFDQPKLVDCVAKGTPTPRLMWVLPGNVILPAPYYSNRVTVHQNGTLEFQLLKRTDSEHSDLMLLGSYPMAHFC
ncbi:Matrix-remodeling-associated protein 5 [Channa argus]|uniref:Matrix-remodeling-associated protein 5 n=1 Tax=Channa argus TaxID=215402 RepID=A0A6G1QVV9_CHAAH|nr:Matrix-remodeling-associated protein 5 [Channa argus]